MLITDPACGARWTGSRREHCPACHRTFNSGYAGDKHRRGTHGIDRRCIDPGEAGLVPTVHTYKDVTFIVWSTPGREDIREVLDNAQS